LESTSVSSAAFCHVVVVCTVLLLTMCDSLEISYRRKLTVAAADFADVTVDFELALCPAQMAVGWTMSDSYHLLKLYKQAKRHASMREKLVALALRELASRHSRTDIMVWPCISCS